LNTAVFFQDNFERADSDTVGNGWTEVDGSASAEAGVYEGRMNFTYNDDAWQPIVSHTFEKQSAGIIQWNFTFAFDRVGAEGNYRVYLQLGDSSLMVAPSTETNIRTGVGVNLGWMDNADAGVPNDESLVYWENGFGDQGQQDIAVLSGPLSAPSAPLNLGGIRLYQ